MGAVVGIVLLGIAGVLFLVAKKGWIDNSTLQTLTNVAGIVALLAAVAVFIFPQQTPDPVISTPPPPRNDKSGNGSQSKLYSKKTYDVRVVLPSRMSDATILVDGKPALIVNQTPTVVTIRVVEKKTEHQITVKKDGYSCTQKRLIEQNNLILKPCQ